MTIYILGVLYLGSLPYLVLSQMNDPDQESLKGDGDPEGQYAGNLDSPDPFGADAPTQEQQMMEMPAGGYDPLKSAGIGGPQGLYQRLGQDPGIGPMPGMSDISGPGMSGMGGMSPQNMLGMGKMGSGGVGEVPGPDMDDKNSKNMPGMDAGYLSGSRRAGMGMEGMPGMGGIPGMGDMPGMGGMGLGDMPGMGGMGMGGMPGMGGTPGMGGMPGMGVMPGMEGMRGMPGTGMRDMPGMDEKGMGDMPGAGDMGGMPGMDGMGMGGMPGMGGTGMRDTPGTDGMGMGGMPGMGEMDMGEMPGMGGMGMVDMPNMGGAGDIPGMRSSGDMPGLIGQSLRNRDQPNMDPSRMGFNPDQMGMSPDQMGPEQVSPQTKRIPERCQPTFPELLCKHWRCLLTKYKLLNDDDTLNEDKYYTHLERWLETNPEFANQILQAKVACKQVYRFKMPLNVCIFFDFNVCIRNYVTVNCPNILRTKECLEQKKFYTECREFYQV